MDHDELRARLQAADPARHDAPATSWIDELVEATVSTDQEQVTKETRRPRWLVPAAAAAAVAGIAAAGVVAFGGSEDDGPKEAPTVMALEAPPANSMASCVMFDVEFLRPMQTAFDGTVTDIEGQQVTLEVNRWYKGGDADVVEVTNFDAAMTSLDGLDFEEGKRYLVTAESGTVNVCGFSGEYNDEMAAAFDEAFGG